ncbi:PREDICTED: bridging integrator 3-like isoform X2 [Priapulus caudatus]|uniref:Bridging integrator 3-like isoform X2 n=1 Tax=Priapulus caudatus TaxID=37621 RepID=A0ABM1DVF6_PRICU|nr:PREDICTED: bridging integrator 3-like isoform X2 [Priapulus caudatus]
MSWNPFSKNLSTKSSIILPQDEKNFQREVARLHQLDEATKNLYKDTKKYIDASAGVAKADMKMSQNLSSNSAISHDPILKESVEALSQATFKLTTSSQELNTKIQKVMLEPIRKFGTIFPVANNLVKKRDHLLQECSQKQSRVEKYEQREKTGTNIVKLDQAKKALAPVQEEFVSINKSLMEDIPYLWDSRIAYTRPSLAALIQAEVQHNREVFNIYEELEKALRGDNIEVSEEVCEYQMNKRLREIQALSIIADD